MDGSHWSVRDESSWRARDTSWTSAELWMMKAVQLQSECCSVCSKQWRCWSVCEQWQQLKCVGVFLWEWSYNKAKQKSFPLITMKRHNLVINKTQRFSGVHYNWVQSLTHFTVAQLNETEWWGWGWLAVWEQRAGGKGNLCVCIMSQIVFTFYFSPPSYLSFIPPPTVCTSTCSCRINGILESPWGNALLVGVGGSGKPSLTRLAAFISNLEFFQITLKKGYGIPDLKVWGELHSKLTSLHKHPSALLCLSHIES